MKKIIGLIIVIGIIGLAGYEALMYYDNNFRYGRMRETPAVRPYEEPLLKMEAGLVPINGGEAVYRTTAGIDLIAPIKMEDATVIARGKAVYLTFCAQCHGYNHDGTMTVTVPSVKVSNPCRPIYAAPKFKPHSRGNCLSP